MNNSYTPKRFGFNTHGNVVPTTIDLDGKRNVTIIAAMASNGGIGNDGVIPWKLSEDMKQFRRLTTGHVVIMGRVTFESLGKPLPNRVNIVLTRNEVAAKQIKEEHPEVIVFTNLTEALDASGNRQIFIIGGTDIYQQAMPLADDMILTRLVDFNPAFDRAFPSVVEKDWHDIAYCEHQSQAQPSIKYRYYYYHRKS